jgi:ABC-type Fe3+/spermidine/putrescine transport system ATPase subunit
MGFANLRPAVVTEATAHEVGLDSSGLQLAASNAGHSRRRGQAVSIGIRQEKITMHRPGAEQSGVNAVGGKVASAIYHGNAWSYRVSTAAGDMQVARAPDDSDQGRGFEVGAAVALSWDKSAVRVFDA